MCREYPTIKEMKAFEEGLRIGMEIGATKISMPSLDAFAQHAIDVLEKAGAYENANALKKLLKAT